MTTGGFNRDHALEQRDEHYTPKHIFETMALKFDLDVAAPTGGVSWIPAKEHFDENSNGLESSWFGRVWMNPPYSKPTPWVNKFLDHGNGVALLVVSRSQWFRDMWDQCDAIVPTPYNMKFERPDGAKKQISFQTFLFAKGEENAAALNNFGRRVR
jgi:hypothetical protein